METRRSNVGYGRALGITSAILLALTLPHSYASDSCSQKKHPEFKDYSIAKMFSGTAHPAILATPLDRKYRMAIRESVSKGVNFAGHFVVADWGCGTGCRQFVVVDAETGIIYDPPFAEVDYHYPKEGDADWWCYSDLLNYRKDSALLIVEGCLRGKQCGRTYFVMSDALKQLSYDPDMLPDGTIAPY